MEDRLLTLDEVAWYLRLSHMTIYRMIERGELRAVKIANQWRFSREEVEQWLTKSMPSKKLAPPSFLPEERTAWEKKYRPPFHQFVRDIVDTRPDILALVDRRGARLFSEWEEIPPDYQGIVTCSHALDCIPEADINGKYIALLDDSVQHGATLHHKRKDLERRKAVVRTFAFLGCDTFLSGRKELEDPEVQVCFRLADSQFTRACAEVTEYLLEQGKTQDTDHFALLLLIQGKRHPVTLEQFLDFLSGLGNVFIVSSPAEENDVITITLDHPVFFQFDACEVPVSTDFEDGVVKIRFYFNRRTNTCLCLPIAMPKVTINPETYFDTQRKGEGLPINLKNLGLSYNLLSEKQKAQMCYLDTSINISLALAQQFLKRLTSKDSPFRISLGEPPINSEDLERCYGKELGDKLSEQIVQHLRRSTEVKVGRAYQGALLEEQSQFTSSSLQSYRIAERQLQALFEITPVIKLLTHWYDELKTKVHDREERLTDYGLTFSEICGRLEGQMESTGVSLALDLGLDRTVIAPVHLMQRLSNGEWEIRKAYRPGESAPGDPPEVGHRDSKALDPAVFRFRRDKFLVPFVIDRLMKYCPSQKNGVEPFLLFKVLACLRRDWLTQETRHNWTFWEATPAAFGPLPEIPRSTGFVEDGGNPYQLAQAGGSFFEFKPVQIHTKTGTRTRNCFLPVEGWRDVIQQYYEGEELSNVDAYLQFYAIVYNRLDDSSVRGSAVDTLLTLSACFNEEITYKYAHKNLSLWIARFGHFIDLCREKVICGTISGDIAQAIIDCERTAVSAIDKISRYDNIQDTETTVKQMIERQDNLVLLKLGREILERIDRVETLTTRLIVLRQMGEMMKAISTLAKYIFSRVEEFQIPDTRSPDEQKNKLNHYLDEAKEKARGLIKVQERFTPLDSINSNVTMPMMSNLIESIDLLYQEVRLSFHHNCPMPELGPEEDPARLLAQINFAEQWLRKYAVKEGIFMFTDLDRSTIEFSDLDPVAIAKIIQWYNESMKNVITQFAGDIRKAEGDGNFIIFKDKKSALNASVIILKQINQLVERVGLLPMCIGILGGSYFDMDSGVPSRNELGSQINWAKKLASLDPPGLYVTEDMLASINELGIPYRGHAVPDAFKALGRKVLSVDWNLVDQKAILK